MTSATRNDRAITIAFCRSHLCREFYDAAKAGTETLSRIVAPYRIEAAIRGATAERRRVVRQAERRPPIENLQIWFIEQWAKLPGHSPTADDIRYAMPDWPGLVRFLEAGRVELDTISIERTMRPVKSSKK